jgi:hypothetical protein
MALQPQIVKKEEPKETITVICIFCNKMITAEKGQQIPTFMVFPLNLSGGTTAVACLKCTSEALSKRTY